MESASALLSATYVVSQDNARSHIILAKCDEESDSSSSVANGSYSAASSSSSIIFASQLLLDGGLFRLADESRYIFCPGSLLAEFEGVDVLVSLGYYLNKDNMVDSYCKCIAAT
jgi:hypothetical protein